jgi:hypothetical protein
MQPVEVLHEDESLRVSLLRNTNAQERQTLISFAGIGLGADDYDIQKHEFFNASKWYSSTLFVSDVKRSWGNSIDTSRLQDLVAPFAAGGPVDTLGNSMGGFLALVAPSLFAVRRSVAIVPQVCVHPVTASWENRWMPYRTGITGWKFVSAADHLNLTTAYTVGVGVNKNDAQHVSLLPDIGNLSILRFPNGGHTLANRLKRTEKLESFLSTALSGGDMKAWMKSYTSPGDVQTAEL